MNRVLTILGILALAISCGEPEARWPVEAKSGSFLKLSAERNRRLLEQEEALMAQLMARDSAHTYQESASGTHFYYEVKSETPGYKPQPDDLVTLRYNLTTWNDEPLYREEEIGTLRYKVDKQELFPGLRNSVKLLQEGETAVFLFPSSLGYGYHGDNDRIGPNLPLKSRITLLKIEKNTESLPSNP